MKVLHIISGDLWAGAEVMASQLVEGLVADYPKIEVSVMLLNEGRLADEIRAIPQVDVQVIPEKEFNFIQVVKKARSLVGQLNPDLIHTHRYKENIIGLLSSWPNKKIALVSTQHGLPETNNQRQGIVKQFVSSVNMLVLRHRFDGVVAVSKNIRTFFTDQHGLAPERVSVIHNGLAVKSFAAETAPESGEFRIGSSGRLCPVKGYDLMVEIAASLVGQADIRFMIAGDGPLKEELQRRIDDANIADKFILLGHLDEMTSFYSDLAIYLNTSHHEGIPMTILEAMSHGVPVVAPRVGGIPEIITDGAEGFLIDSRNPENFAEKCLELIRSSELREKIARSGVSRVNKDFSSISMCSKYFALYQTLSK